MNYTNCYRLFTNDQKNRMQASCVTTTRSGLATSWANNQGVYPTVWTPPIAPSVTPTSSLLSANSAGITNVSLNNRIVYSLNASRDGGYMNNSGKWYDLFEMSANGNYTLNVTLGASINDEQLCVWIDYDNNGSFNNGNEQIYLNNDIPFVTGLNGISINFTVPAASFISTGQIVRMRMMDDRSTALGVAAMNSSSATLSYGQAEDYPVYLQSGPLPLTLLSFTGSKRNDVIRLLWKTEQEQDTKEFQVERSMNSFEFASIGIIPAAGLSTGSNYNFSDPAITPGAYFYRLKMLDRDGAYTYSRTLDFTVKGNRMLVKGNPFHQDIEVILPANSGEVVFRLLDSKGSVVLVEKQGISSNSIVIKLKKPLSNGIYVLEATVNGEYFSEKVIRQ